MFTTFFAKGCLAMNSMALSFHNSFFRHRLFGVLALASVLLTSCVTSVDVSEMARSAAERRRGPRPESEWNTFGIWRRIANNPATYIPRDYSVSAPRGKADGSWVVDVRDGKRLFVPNKKVGDYESSVLMGEAKKITNWQAREIISTVPGIMVMP
jgi:hypothetical protein